MQCYLSDMPCDLEMRSSSKQIWTGTAYNHHVEEKEKLFFFFLTLLWPWKWAKITRHSDDQIKTKWSINMCKWVKVNSAKIAHGLKGLDWTVLHPKHKTKKANVKLFTEEKVQSLFIQSHKQKYVGGLFNVECNNHTKIKLGHTRTFGEKKYTFPLLSRDTEMRPRSLTIIT